MTPERIGRYEIVSELGRGGMAIVYLARDPSIKREVAIKVLPVHFLQDTRFLERFNREVQVIARLQHPRILPVYDFGEEGGMPYIVMAYMPGGTLAQRIQRDAGVPLAETARLAAQVAEGLDCAHGQGVIHRDFKPSNVLFDKKGNIYLADFGIAKVTEETAQLTGSGIVGTPAYMAPEMSRPGGLSPLVDVYALGVTIYEMLTGDHPFHADTPMGIVVAHVVQPVPDIRLLRPDLSDKVQAVVARALAKDPMDRYPTAGDLAADLQAAMAAGTIAAPPARPAPSPSVLEAPTMDQPQWEPTVVERAAPRRTGKPAWLIGGIAVLAVGIVGAGIFGTLALSGALGGKGGGQGAQRVEGTGDQTATPTATGGLTLIDGFESASLSLDTASDEEGSTIECKRDSASAWYGKSSWSLQWNLVPNGWAYCYRWFEGTLQDWSNASGLSLWYTAGAAGQPVAFWLHIGDPGTTYSVSFNTTAESTQGWAHLVFSWEDFALAPWIDKATDEFDLRRLNSYGFTLFADSKPISFLMRVDNVSLVGK